MYAMLFIALAIASPDDDARAALALAQTAKTKPAPVPIAKPKPNNAKVYSEARTLALAMREPLIIFVATPGRSVRGTTCCQLTEFEGDASPRVIVAVIDGGSLTRYAVSPGVWHLPAKASDADIMRAMSPRAVSQSAVPFSATKGKRATADDDLSGYGPWPKSLEKIKGLVRYVPATMTQQTFNKGIIQAVPISELQSKWHQSGGMEGVEGWRSDLYKMVPSEVAYRRSWVPVFNGSNDQDESAFTRSYPDGVVFFDVLSKDGEPFEARKAEKKAGRWKREVVFRNEAHYPVGYVGLKQTCSSCHDEAGRGGYAVGLAPGGDSVLSDPIPQLEAGYRDCFGG